MSNTFKNIKNSNCIIYKNGSIRNMDTGLYYNWTQHNRTKLLITNIKINGIRKTVYQHKLIAEYFISNPKNKKYVDHINKNVNDNRINNLIWVDATKKQLNAYKKSKFFAKKNTISYKSVIDIRTKKVYRSVSEAAIYNRLSRTYLSNMLNGIVENKTTLQYYN